MISPRYVLRLWYRSVVRFSPGMLGESREERANVEFVQVLLL
jgi:hypothetical protein